MTKVGEGNQVPLPPNYQEQLEGYLRQFQGALVAYQKGDSAQKAHLKGVMDQVLLLIRSAVKEMKQPGMMKQETLVETDYQAYMKNDSAQNFSKLGEDLTTLHDYNQLHE
ncbi:MAG: hypothetical protein KGR16_05435 [Verrucomicrobia bacterium]|nr:hypothetical protein [Verrucomicrobiota bacterium]MDE3047097.1 hypothetical protein [Verrucomicrobiota bacterium]